MSALLRRLLPALTLLASSAWLGGCATVPDYPVIRDIGAKVKQSPGQKLDPWENWNRKVFQFNDDVDNAVVKPVATFYRKVTPEFVRTGVTNFYANFADGWSAVNQLLQGKLESGMTMAMRFAWNTGFGLFGTIDMASEMGLERQSEDFGQTLGRWGFAGGPYMVLPIFGPSNVRDTIALPLDRSVTPGALVTGGANRVGIAAFELVNTRSELLAATKLLDEIALDRYSFVRDAYLARRRSQIYDGDPPDAPDLPDAAPNAAAPASAAGAASAPR